MLVDSHCHLDFADFDEDREDVIKRARDAGVETMVSISTRLADFEKINAIAEAHDGIFCTLGVHPHEADAHPELSAAGLVARAGGAKTIGLGETGLDYFYENSARDAQMRAFEAHMDAAQETGLPLIIHSRSADEDMMRFLRKAREKGVCGLLHCFTGGRALAEVALEVGFYISFSGILTFKNAEELRQTARALPLERILVETDAPFLAPEPHRGKRNEPAFVAHTAAYLARVKEVDADMLARATTDNFFRLFTKAFRS